MLGSMQGVLSRVQALFYFTSTHDCCIIAGEHQEIIYKSISHFLDPFFFGLIFFKACLRRDFNLGDFGWPSDEVDGKVLNRTQPVETCFRPLF